MNVVVALLIDAVTNKLPVLTVAAEPVATVTVNCELSPFVNVKVFEFTLPVVIKLPVLTVAAEPVATVTVNCELSPFVKVITLLTALAVVNNEAVFTVTPAFKAYDAVTAKDAEVALVAKDELVAVCDEVANELLKATELYDDDILVALFDELTAKLALTA